MRRKLGLLSALCAWAMLAALFVWADGATVGGTGGLDAAMLEEAQEALARYDEPAAAQEFFALKRSPQDAKPGQPEGPGPVGGQAYLEAERDASKLNVHTQGEGSTSPGGANDFATPWAELGPGNIGGRTRALVVHPTNPLIMYAGAVAGGVWKSTDGGASWTPLDDLMPNLAVASLAMDPDNPNVLYAGTGEGFFNADAVRGAGIFKSTNAGASWTQLASTANSNFFYVNDLVVSPASSAVIYAATQTGVLRSLDSGATWTTVLNASLVNGCLDLAHRTDTGATDTVFAACGTFVQGSIYRNTDANGVGTWTSVYTDPGMRRTSLAIAPSNQSVVYALVAGSSHAMFAVLRSTTGGGAGSWTTQNSQANPDTLSRLLLTNPYFAQGCQGGAQFFTQGWYDNVIAVDPVNSDRVWTGGIDLFRSDDGGATFGLASFWTQAPGTANYVHADQHTIVFHPGYNGTTNKTMFVGNDGGIFRTDDATEATATGATAACVQTGQTDWTDLNNGYSVTQFYDGVPYPSGTEYFGGTQDNGTLRGTTAGGEDWSTIFGGDGGYVAVDPTNTNVLFEETTGLSIRKSTNGGSSFALATSGISNVGFLFITPFHMAPSNPQVLFIGGSHIWRTTNQASSWVQASTDVAGGSISALASAPTDGNRALAGTQDGQILRSSTALSATSATVWANVLPRGGYVSSVTFHPTDPDIAYATYATFGGTHVWRTADGGATWAPRDGTGPDTLPDIPVHSIAIRPSQPTHLYAGTDLGVFVSLDEGLTWARENTGFSNVVTEKLVINSVGGVETLYAFTHGRSAWKVPLAAATAELVVDSTTVDDTCGNGNGGIDFNECVDLDVVLANVGAPATGISATLTSDTPGVSVLQPTATYPDLGTSATASGTPPFRIFTDPSFPVGTPIELTLTIAGTGGPFVRAITLPTGSGTVSTQFAATGPIAIPDATQVDVNLPITVSGLTSPITDVDASVYITHPWDADLDIDLKGPDNTTIDLSSDNGSSGNNFGTDCPAGGNDTTFDDEALSSITGGTAPFVGSFRPEQALSAFDGKSGAAANGTWRLVASDDEVGDVGSIQCVTLTITQATGVDGGGPPGQSPPVGDFDGDGDTDIGVFRPSVGGWYIRDQATVFFGLPGDIPVPGDYNGDGLADRAVFRPDVGGWYINGQATVFHGLPGDIPVPADYNGDGTTDIAIYRPSVGGWYINGQPTVFHGLSTDTPVPGDYDGNSLTDIAIYRPSVGGWYIKDQATVFHGLSTDTPVPGDYNGDGLTDVAVFRGDAGAWLIKDQPTVFLGLDTDIPVPGDYNADGLTDVAVFRADTGAWYINNQATTYHGLPGDIPTPKRPTT